MSAEQPPLALTLGEPAGIGPDIAIAAWRARHSRQVPPFVFVGHPAILLARAARIGADVRARETPPAEADRVFDTAIPCLPGQSEVSDAPGRPSTANSAAVIASIERAVAMVVKEGTASALVTGPIHKKTLADAGFRHPGHTEFLGALAAEGGESPVRPVMMLVAPGLRTVPVTIHLPLSQVSAILSTSLIVDTATIVARDLKRRFGIKALRLAVAGLNPHAGEGGLLGGEDEAVIRPAVDALVQTGMACVGPLPADAMFHAAARAKYDVALCMYHDQALIPVKTLAFDEAVNVTLGLPFVRTSPDHGTALDIAGTGRARPESLIAALNLATALAGPKR